MIRRRLAVAVAVIGFALGLSPGAGADDAKPALDGTYKQSGMREDFTVEQWQGGCGPAPTSQTQGGGETVLVRTDGDELVVSGGGRVWRTDQCYDPMPTLARVSHSRDPNGRAWTTRCSTPGNDARHGRATTQVTVTGSRIDIVETGRYELSVNDGMCIANVKRTRSFMSQAPAPAPTQTATALPTPPPAPTPEPTQPPAPSGFCATKGPPARLAVVPSRKFLKTGDTFQFQATIQDAQGCALGTEPPPVWSVAEGTKGVSVDALGKVTVDLDAPEGTSELYVSAAGKRVKVSVEVAAFDHYDRLLAQKGGVTESMDDTSSVALVAQGSSPVQAEDTSRKRRFVFLSIVSALAIILGIAWFVAARRSRRAKALEQEVTERYEAQVRDVTAKKDEKRKAYESQLEAHEKSKQAREAALAAKAARAAKREEAARAAHSAQSSARQKTVQATSETMRCPVCSREYEKPLAFCPHDGTSLVVSTHDKAPSPHPVCPVCKKGFGVGALVCPDHGEPLVPRVTVQVGSREGASDARPKICPTCGGRFQGTATFCGKDGTVLVTMN